MSTLTSKAFAELYAEMVAEAAKLGWPGCKNSKQFLKYINTEYDKQFKKP